MPNHEISTYDHLEADLALNIDQEKVITKAEREAVYENAAKGVLSRFGKHVDKGIVESVFPGVDLENIDSYDFKNSKLAIFFVDSETMEKVAEANGRHHVQAMHINGQAYKHLLDSQDYENVQSNRSGLIIIDKDIVEKRSNIDSKNALESVLRHEILHALRIGYNLPDDLEEGLVTYLQIKSGEVNFLQHSNLISESPPPDYRLDLLDYFILAKEVFINESYTSRAAVFSVIHNICVSKYGWTDDEFYESVINMNSPRSKEIAGIMAKNAGSELMSYFNLMSQYYARDIKRR